MSLIQVIASPAGIAPVGAPGAPSSETFDEWLPTTNSGAGPGRYWPMDDVSGSTMVASIGGLNGTYVNTADLDLGITDAALVEYVGFGGTSGYATITTPVTTSAFTFMQRVQFDSAAEQMILAMTEFTTVAGQFIISVIDDGAGGLKPLVSSKDSGGISVTYRGTSPGSVPIGTFLYFFYLRTATGGQEVWIVDSVAGTAQEIPLTLTFGTAPGSWSAPPAGPVYIGSSPAPSALFNGVANRLAFWGVAIPRTDIQNLALIGSADEPFVVWAKALDAGTVNESAALNDISVLDHIHPEVGYTLSVTDGTGTHGTLTTDTVDLTYTAGAVTGDQTDTAMSWRISRGGVFSPTVGFTIDVLETGGGGGVTFTHTAFNPFDETGATFVTVSSMTDLQTQVNNATGKKVVRISGTAATYSGGTLSFTRAAGSTSQVIIRPLGTRGDITISGGTWTFSDSSSWLVVKDIYFSGARIQFGGSHNRITRCRWRNISGSSIRLRDSHPLDCRIDHCDFATATSTSGRMIEMGSINPWGLGTSARMLVDHCYVHAWGQSNSITMGFATPPSSGYHVARGQSITYDHCLFDGITYSGEWIVNKIGGYVYRYCTFDNIGGYLSLPRSGNNCELRSCYIAGMSSPQMWGNNSLVIGNRFLGSINCYAPVGNDTYTAIADGSGDPAGYPPCTNSSFLGNRFKSGNIRIGWWWSNPPSNAADLRANNITVQANTRDDGGSAHIIDNSTLNPGGTNITVLSGTPSTPYDPAVQLTSSDVGLAAPDPYA